VDVGQDAAVLRYTPPDGRACVVEYGISAEPGSVIRADDRGGTRQRQVVLSGLVADTQYSYVILCAAQRPGGSFRTRPASGDLVSVPVYLVPPTGIPVSEALAEYGPTEALGSTSEPVGCAGGCTIQVPAGAGRAVYRRVIYRDADHSMLARGAVEATIAH